MPILILLAVVAVVWARLPKVKGLAHLEDKTFRWRRGLNWLPLGLTYAFLYWGRYNLQPAIQNIGGPDMIADFNWVFGVGTAVYGISFLINGPLTDRKGGRFSILVGAIGAAIANLLMGIACWMHLSSQLSANTLFWCLVVLYPINMYFQSFGAVAIVKVNAAWFHVDERGTFGAIFGILISLGIYFAFDWSYAIVGFAPANWAFYAPAIALGTMFLIDIFVVRNKPSEIQGLEDINTADASAGDTSPLLPAMQVFKKMFTNPVIIMIACIEFCSGFLRQAIMQLYRFFAKSMDATLHLRTDFVYENWGLLLCCAGIMGGVFAGFLSDHVFKARRGPVTALLYLGMLAGSAAMCFMLGSPMIGWLVIFMSLCVIGVHGMLSGVASQDFGGVKNVGVAVGIIDGFVYAGTATQAILYANILPKGETEAAAVLSNWYGWPIAMVPFAIIGLFLAYRIRNAKPKPKTAG
ncbi:MAG: MFS transporter [Patescibacteria group bacterium]